MNQNSSNTPHPSPTANETPQVLPEETLRLLASLNPPIGIADRVHYRLQQARNDEPARRSFWSQWMLMRRLQYAGAAVLVLAVGGSTWGIYHHPVPPAKTAIHGISSQGTAGQGAFGNAAATRRPSTLAPIKVTPAPKKKPSAARQKSALRQSATQPAEASANKASVNP